jgi:hypothetical protein
MEIYMGKFGKMSRSLPAHKGWNPAEIGKSKKKSFNA